MVAWMWQLSWFAGAVCLLLTFFAGYAVASYSVYFTAAMQALIPPALLGRFAALRRMVSTAMVGGAAYCFAAGYAKGGAHGAVATTLAMEMLVLAGCAVWIVMRRRLQYAVMPSTSDFSPAATAADYDDLKPVFERFVKKLSRRALSR
jgi:hypothetical protein